MTASYYGEQVLSILSAPDGVPVAPPTITRHQVLPFAELSWENFERLCHRLLSLDGNVDHCARYGLPGEAQAGIDVYARLKNEKYHCLQAKRHRSFSAAQIRDAVDLFVAGKWLPKAAQFTIAVQTSLQASSVQEMIESQALRLLNLDVKFEVMDGEMLTEQLRCHPHLIDDFFGRPWVTACLGIEAATKLHKRLDGANFALLRSELTRAYQSQFHFVDPGSFGSTSDSKPALTLLERFLKPDILQRENAEIFSETNTELLVANSADRLANQQFVNSEHSRDGLEASASRIRRIPIKEWIGSASQLVILGDAGSGKSTLLRVIALDLMHDHHHFPEFGSRWGFFLPIYIPFARWSAQIARAGKIIGLNEVIRETIGQILSNRFVEMIVQALDDGRVILLIDGLDEWSNEQAARTTLGTIVASAEYNNIPIIVSSRPRGLEKIGALPTAWKRGTIAPLSLVQQADIAVTWFSRFSSIPDEMELRQRTKHFMAELARDISLSALASSPLLLIGLITLTLRGQTLPRTRRDIFDSLVRILLEIHPNNRATAAGDTEYRLRHTSDPEQLRASIAYLAFAMRKHGGGSGMSFNQAKCVLQEYLSGPDRLALDRTAASNAAKEIIAVNSETQGLLFEKSPGEIGFVHASFEEYLCAEHISRWPFKDIKTFVRGASADSMWRNVIANLLGEIQRRDEIDELVGVIEEEVYDEFVALRRKALLGDIGISITSRAPVTAKRLALEAIGRVETEDWLPARREALASVLKGILDPILKEDITKKLNHWMPAAQLWRRPLLEALTTWEPTRRLQETIYRTMHDDHRDSQRAAAKAYATLFSKDDNARLMLVTGLAKSRDVHSSAAMLEGLALGWPQTQSSKTLFKQAWETQRGSIRLVGGLGLAMNGERGNVLRDLTLQAQHFWSGLPHEYQSLAQAMILEYWPNDKSLIDSALKSVTKAGNSDWNNSTAGQYLLRAESHNPQVCDWIFREFDKDYPFNFALGSCDTWRHLGRFALAVPEIQKKISDYWQKPQSRILNFHFLPDYAKVVPDSSLLKVLETEIEDGAHKYHRLWAIRTLLVGWGGNHPFVQKTVNRVLSFSDDELQSSVALIPMLYQNKQDARVRLLKMGRLDGVRSDLLLSGFVNCGSSGSDEEAVSIILDSISTSRDSDSIDGLFRFFGGNPKIRDLAKRTLATERSAAAGIAIGYPNDPEFTDDILAAANVLPVDLRSQIVELATNGATGTVLEPILEKAFIEVDPELSVRMAIAHFSRLPLASREGAKEELLQRAKSIGFTFETTRASALAGIIAIDAIDALVSLQDRGKPVQLTTGRMLTPIHSLERQICEKFASFQSAFGAALPARFNSIVDSNQYAEIITAAPSASSEVRTAFIALAEGGKLPLTVRATRSLAAERPNSDLLLTHCMQVLQERPRDNNRATVNAEIGLVLHANFPNDLEVKSKLTAMFASTRSIEDAVTLAIYAPHSNDLAMPNLNSLGYEFGDWTLATHLSAHRSKPSDFIELIELLVQRPSRSQFDAQQVTNFAILQRLRVDDAVQRLIANRIDEGANRSVSGSCARYLSAAGKLDGDTTDRIGRLLHHVNCSQIIVVAGYDAQADEWRGLRSTLLDALVAGSDIAL